LAAGFGIRMGEYTKNIPKPLLLINNVPLIYYSLYNFYKWKIEKIYINVHYLGDMILEKLYGYPHAKLIFSKEKNILGTAGGIRTAIGNDLNQFLVLLNPDTILIPDGTDFQANNLFSENFHSMLYVSEKKENTEETGFDFTSEKDPGVLSFSDSGRYYYIGFSIINGQILKNIPPSTKSELGEIWKNSNTNLRGRVFRGSYFDCGNASSYEILRDKKIYTEKDLDWEKFRKSCRI